MLRADDARQMLDDELLQEYIDKFYGHGNLSGKYWLIGMEHGGGDSFENILLRLNTWATIGKTFVNDLVDYGNRIGEAAYYDGRGKHQPTWNKLIRLLLSLEGEEEITIKKIKQYQALRLGRRDGDNCLLELLPLANPSLGHPWLYGIHSTLPYLCDRKTYHDCLAPLRAKRLRQLVVGYRPRYIFFYGKVYESHWREIAERVSFVEQRADTQSFLYGYDRHTIYVIIHHPVAKGITSNYFHEVGKFLRHFKTDA